jgi:hypothetical protein
MPSPTTTGGVADASGIVSVVVVVVAPVVADELRLPTGRGSLESSAPGFLAFF